MKRNLLIALIVSVSQLLAGAGPRIVAPNDPAGAEIREAASALFQHIADGDVGGAKALFDGPPEHLKLLEAQLAFSTRSEELKQAISQRFGNVIGVDGVSASSLFRRFSEVQKTSVMIRTGDGAALAAGPFINLGVDLHKTPIGWKVVHLSMRASEVERPLKLYTALADLMRELRSKVEAGKFADATDAMTEAGRRTQTTCDDWETASLSNKAPETANGIASAQPPLTSAELRSLLGKPLTSPEITLLINALPALPHISVRKTGVWILSFEAGIELFFNNPGGNLAAVDFYSQDADGYHRYAGQLPDNLSWGQTRQAVEKLLGPPNEISGGSRSPINTQYGHLGISLQYARPGGHDPDNPLRVLTLAEPSGPAPKTARPVDQPHLQFRLVLAPNDPAAKDAERLPDPIDVTGKTILLVSRSIILDEKNIQDVSPMLEPNQIWVLSLRLDEPGAKQMNQVSTMHQGAKLAIVWDNRVLIAPTINGQIGDSVVITLGAKSTAEEVGKLGDQIRNAAFSLPVK